jgi:ElaB/YqjD/DUF883 family membrane-anchored ribosome-binding protein
MENNCESANLGAEEITKQKLVSDFKAVAHDAEALIRATAGDLGEKAKEARSQLTAALERAKVSCREMQEKALEIAQEKAKATDRCIREHPYQTLGIAFALGLVLGVLIRRE